MKKVKLEELKDGDIVLWEVSNVYSGIARVKYHDGHLCMDENLFGKNYPIKNWIYGESWYGLTKMSLVDLYKFCKEYRWDTGYYISKFGKRKV